MKKPTVSSHRGAECAALIQGVAARSFPNLKACLKSLGIKYQTYYQWSTKRRAPSTMMASLLKAHIDSIKSTSKKNKKQSA